MNEKLSKLKDQISKIESLKSAPQWGPEFQLWERATKKLLKEIFGDEEVKLFEQQTTVTFSYIDEGYNQQQYFSELGKKKKILDALLAEMEEYNSKNITEVKDETNILKTIWKKEQALKENLLTTQEAEGLQKSLIAHIEKTLIPDSIPSLRFRKLQAERRFQTWWSDSNGYPVDKPWPMIEPFLELLQQHDAEKTIKKRFETEGLFVESRSQGEDQHLIVGERDGNGEKAHIIIDGKSGEIRTEDNRKEPTELFSHIETILTRPDGKKIRTTREAIEEIK